MCIRDRLRLCGLDSAKCVDYRQYDMARDGKTKMDHVMDMMKEIIRKEVPFTHFLMDSWYAVTEILNQIMDWNKLFVCAIKSNRLFSPDEIDEHGKHVQKIRTGFRLGSSQQKRLQSTYDH